jgi:transposase
MNLPSAMTCLLNTLNQVGFHPNILKHQTVPAPRARGIRFAIEGIKAEHLLADRGYDSDAIIEQARQQGMQADIPPRKNRKNPRSYDRHLYRYRHLVENAFLYLKRWRGIATRYAKSAASFLAAVQIRCLVSLVGRLVTMLSRVLSALQDYGI